MDNFEEKSFGSYSLIKAVGEDDDSYIVNGPVADVDRKDYSKDILAKAGVLNGLVMFQKLGMHVDWEHMYPKTKQGKYIIGKGMEITEVDDMPYLVTRLRKGNEFAEEAWRMLKDNIRLGYSIWGKGFRSLNNPHDVYNTEIHLVSIAPMPQGFGQFLSIGKPPPSLYAIAKSLIDDESTVGVQEIWTPGCPGDFDTPYDMSKAFTTGSGIVQQGESGGAALRVQSLEQPGSDKPKRRRRKKRTAPDQELVKALEAAGSINPRAAARLICGEVLSLRKI